MSIELNRHAIARIAQTTTNAHPGLLLARGLNRMASGQGNQNGADKVALLKKLCDTPAPALYQHAYARWQAATADTARFRHLYARTLNRLFIGLSASTAIETGTCTQHSYGMPMIPGSSVKGCARAWATAIGMPDDYRAVLFGEDEKSAKAGERQPGPGSLIWHDAWWVPAGNQKPFVQEVVTVHHQAYYAGRADATDFDSPVPNAQIAVQGCFHFVIEGDPAWADLAIKLLQQALARQGIGAKRAAGYGLMERDEQAERQAKALRKQAALAQLGATERIKAWLSGMDEQTLAESFGNKRARTREEFLQQYSEADWAQIPALGQQIHGERIAVWSSETKKSNKARFKAYKFFTGQTGDEE